MKHRFRNTALSNLRAVEGTDEAPQTVQKEKLLKPFVDATLNTFQVQCQVPAVVGQEKLYTDRHEIHADIAAVIGLFGKNLNGAVSLFFDEPSYLLIMSKMLQEKFSVLTPEIQDGAGELLNIIFGQAKTALNMNGLAVGKSIPQIITGPSLRIRQLTPKPSVVVPFTFESQNAYLEIGLTQKLV